MKLRQLSQKRGLAGSLKRRTGTIERSPNAAWLFDANHFQALAVIDASFFFLRLWNIGNLALGARIKLRYYCGTLFYASFQTSSHVRTYLRTPAANINW